MIGRLLHTLNLLLLTLVLVVVLVVAGLYFWLNQDLPQLPKNLEQINLSLPTEIYSSDGERIKILGERHPIALEDISPFFTKAITAVEDSRFYRHSGIDHRGLVRALWTNLRQKRIAQGGSTITQQLSKNLFFSFERNWVRKIKELLIAFQLEATFNKDQILEAYCNQIYFGSGAYGVEEAAQVYFRKRARDLTLFQAALLAGLPNSPNNANPFSHYERAMRRTEYVLNRMVSENLVTVEERELALQSDIDLVNPQVESDPNLYFVNQVLEQIEKDYGKEFVHFGGLKILTTLDTRYQKLAFKSARNHLEALEGRVAREPGAGPLQAALVSIENKSGAVRAMLGGRDYSHSQFNRAVSNNRLPGSSFKPFVYFTAMEELGYSPATVVKDEPLTIDIPGSTPWSPQNFDEEFAGDIVLKKALMKSVNIVSAKLINEVGPEKVIRTARQFGIKSPLGKNLSLALGTSGVSPYEMASAYSVIANLGIYNEPYLIQHIEDFQGNRLYEHYYQGVQQFLPDALYPLLNMMQGVIDRGTGRTVRRMGFRHPAGGKTGTTNDFKDAWFNGFTKDISTSVWVGFDDNESMKNKSGKGLTGASAAAPIWVFFMQKALEGKSPVKFPVPEKVKFATVDVQTGYLADEFSLEILKVAVKEGVDLSAPPVLPEEPEPDETELLPAPVEKNKDSLNPEKRNAVSNP
ncbi:MAG: PBP1A family penicillin-binding protein [Nitrospina sp.]|nr:PBP1A family penicillin-binding protein [Nitrospina sp.]MBT3416340.1 PBP1A family penicillin-binding protein [Nitrospina sp.]MBT3856354.1 PBP1A family penicillin-binding protein [Nitrospina sp.]MBT4104753.1 PBP1A family penicillin-binding protein [Nitrospina sp.]MBT4388993.1 PBP1A family penicillin-binding protein [Nitrospina sp.]